MRLLQQILTEHESLIHDAAYDYYGRRLATCSSDQRIKIWDLNDLQGWVCTADWKSHSGAIWKIDWAAPEFGQVIASCSFDRSVCIWEEAEDESALGELKKWKKKASFGDSHGSVSSVKFAPPHFGLKLATCSEDNIVRIYEATDITNLSQWQITDQFDTCEGGSGGVMSIAWNTFILDPPTLAIGTTCDPNPRIWQYNEKTRKWQVIVTLTGHKDVIHDIAWAPNMGKSYHLIATASRDQTAKIWQLTPVKQGQWEPKEIASLDDHRAEVWTVEWNTTGTVLASSGEDGTVRLWKSNYKNEWTLISIIAAEAT
ncbi:nucleoporin SEH1-B-like [Schistocerca gregaria]|uniref:nucleoporin SEH1-B-like n=1 Tax=Schistocerca gregaria TaxID=7010 RepID=UPI00211DE4F4|nr:nucleoporin SEH1-B-like [Schistocerca gregaria]